MLTFVKIKDPLQKSEICELILRRLPLWFGIESAIKNYISDVQRMDMLGVYELERLVGFISVHKHFSMSAEIHVMGVDPDFHRQGLGKRLIETVESELRNDGVRFLTVKTLSSSRPNHEYDQTRAFYLKIGFVPLEEFKTLWDESNPCLFLVKAL